MLLIIFVVLLWNIVLTLMGKADRSRAFCGMVGYCGDKPADPNVMKIFLMYNNSRGGDSTGWVVDDVITKDTIKVEEFLEKNNLVISADQKNYTIIAHARKASFGTLRLSKAHAHPFGIYKDGNEKDQYDLVLAMNGTLNNEEEFAEEFGYPWNKHTHTDTQMLATVMANLGLKDFTKALQLYDGAATLLFYTPKAKNTLCIYKDPARTLYAWQKGPNEVYISSMKEPFKALGVAETDILDFEGNHLYKYVKGELKLKTKVVRTPLTKAASYSQNFVKQPSSYIGGRNAAYNQSTLSTKSNSCSTIHDLDISKMDKGGNTLCFCYDKYFRNHHPVSGEFFVNPNGDLIINEKDSKFNNTYVKKYFIAGYLIKDEASYIKLKQKTYDSDKLSWTKFHDIRTTELLDYVNYPLQAVSKDSTFWVLPQDLQNKFVTNSVVVETTPFLSELKFSFKLAKGTVKGTTIKCCELAGAEPITKAPEVSKKLAKASTEDNKSKSEEYANLLFDTYGEKALEDFIKARLIRNSSEKAVSLYNRARWAIFKMSGSFELANFFYADILMDMALNHDLISGSDVVILANKAASSPEAWGDKSIQKELDRITNLLAEKLKQDHDEEDDDSPVIGGETDITGAEYVDESELSPRDRIKIASMNQSAISVKEVICELQKSNRVLSNNRFVESIESNTEWTELAKKYAGEVNKYGSDMEEFAFAVATILNNLGAITLNQLVDLYKKSTKELIDEVAIRYETYLESSRDMETGDENLNDESEDDEDVYENMTEPEDYEGEMEAIYDGIKDSMKLLLEQCETVEANNITPRMAHIRKSMQYVHDYLVRQVDDPDFHETIS